MKRQIVRIMAFSLASSCFLAAPCLAVPIFFQNESGLADPDTTISFSEVVLADGALMADEYSAFGVTFDGVFYNPQSGLNSPNFAGPSAGNFPETATPPLVTNPFSINFLTPVTQAGVALISSDGTTSFEALLNGTVVASTIAPSSFGPAFTSNYYGFTGGLFDQLRLTNFSPDDAALIDNVEFTPTSVPEPGLLVLVGVGLGAAAASRSRRVGILDRDTGVRRTRRG